MNPAAWKVVGGLAVLGVLAMVMGVPGMSSGTGGSVGSSWKSFQEQGGDFIPPGLDWEVHDPFTTLTPYWRQSWFLENPPKEACQAYMHSPGGRMEIFLTCGTRAQVGEILEKAAVYHDNHPLVEFEPVGMVTTADGVEVQYQVVHMAEGLLAGDAMGYFLGFATAGDKVFIVTAGSREHSFDETPILDVIRTVRLPH